VGSGYIVNAKGTFTMISQDGFFDHVFAQVYTDHLCAAGNQYFCVLAGAATCIENFFIGHIG
jgi:hypothetical protein